MDKEHAEEKRYEALGPFELKNKLAQLAETRHEGMMRNAGWGNLSGDAAAGRIFSVGSFCHRRICGEKEG